MNLYGLEWSDIDWKNSEIQINQNTIYVNKKIYTKDPKTETSKRIVEIPSNVLELLRQYKVYQSKERLLLGDKWVNTNRILTQWNGKIMHPDTISQWWIKFQKKNGIEKTVSLHKLRHTFASLLLATQGVDIKTVSELLGHANIGTTNIYTHALKDNKKGAVKKLQEELTEEQTSGEISI